MAGRPTKSSPRHLGDQHREELNLANHLPLQLEPRRFNDRLEGTSDPRLRRICTVSLTSNATTDASTMPLAPTSHAPLVCKRNGLGKCCRHYAERDVVQYIDQNTQGMQGFGQLRLRRVPSVCNHSQQAESGRTTFTEYLRSGKLQSSSQCRSQPFGQTRRAQNPEHAITDAVQSCLRVRDHDRPVIEGKVNTTPSAGSKANLAKSFTRRPKMTTKPSTKNSKFGCCLRDSNTREVVNAMCQRDVRQNDCRLPKSPCHEAETHHR